MCVWVCEHQHQKQHFFATQKNYYYLFQIHLLPLKEFKTKKLKWRIIKVSNILGQKRIMLFVSLSVSLYTKLIIREET